MEVRNPASGSINEEMKKFLGEELYEKYSGIHPLLALCTYRIRTYSNYGSFQMMFNTEESSLLLNTYRRFMFPLVWIKNIFTPKSKNSCVMLSSTVYKSGRYEALIKGICEKTDVLLTNAATDIVVYNTQNSFSENLKNIFSFSYGKKAVNCFTISGKKLKRAVVEWLDFCVHLYESDCNCLDNYKMADKLLLELSNEFIKRTDYIAKKLAQYNINQYITINQYNLRDIVMISACRKLGIKTKQLEHHASRFMHNIATGEDIYRFCFVDDICCWSESEVDFHKNIYKYECFFGSQSPNIYSVGNPEISYSDALKAVDKYPVQNRITLMVSGLLNKTDVNEVNRQMNFRKEIFRGLKELSDKTGAEILVRYPPGLDIEFRKKEEVFLREMGFKISPSDRNSLMSDICGSCCIVGTISSVLGLSALLGRTVYQITDSDEKYYITDADIHSVPLNCIHTIHVNFSVQPIDVNNFTNYKKLLSNYIKL